MQDVSTPYSCTILLGRAEDTDRLGAWFAHRLTAGDCVLLDGPVGAGKSHFCRALIREKLGHYVDVPSPTFTLVQTYDAAECEIWHADLYRLSSSGELFELGLDDALSDALCLIEWPDRMGSVQPANAIRLHIAMDGDGRRASISAPGRAELVTDLCTYWMEQIGA